MRYSGRDQQTGGRRVAASTAQWLVDGLVPAWCRRAWAWARWSVAGAGLPVSPERRERRESSSASPAASACPGPDGGAAGRGLSGVFRRPGLKMRRRADGGPASAADPGKGTGRREPGRVRVRSLAARGLAAGLLAASAALLVLPSQALAQNSAPTFDDGTDTSPEFNETIGDATVTIPEIGILEAVARSVAHVAERRTAIPEAEIRAVALSHAPGRYTLAEVDGAIDRLVRGGELIEVERRGMDRAFVTDRAVKAERRILASMRAGRGQGKALRTADGVEARLGGTRLTKGQQEAVRTVLLSENRIVGVQGHAGSGKTTMLREVKELLAGRRIQGLAPSAAAARVLGREAGIPSTTLQYFLTRYGDLSDPERLDRARAEYRGAVLAVDESSMIDTVQVGGQRPSEAPVDQPVDDERPAVQETLPGEPLAHRLVGLAADLVGRRHDRRLRALLRLEREPAPRRLGAELLAVHLAHPFCAEPPDRLPHLALPRMHHRGQQRRVALAQNLVHLRGLHPRLLQQPEGLARIHRPQLRRVAHQGHARHPEPVRDPEQRLHARSYEPGDIVVFHRDVFGCRANDVCTVMGRHEGQVILAHADGGERRFRPSGNAATHLGLYDTERIELRAGDRIRWTRNRKAPRPGFGHRRGEAHRLRPLAPPGELRRVMHHQDRALAGREAAMRGVEMAPKNVLFAHPVVGKEPIGRLRAGPVLAGQRNALSEPDIHARDQLAKATVQTTVAEPARRKLPIKPPFLRHPHLSPRFGARQGISFDSGYTTTCGPSQSKHQDVGN